MVIAKTHPGPGWTPAPVDDQLRKSLAEVPVAPDRTSSIRRVYDRRHATRCGHTQHAAECRPLSLFWTIVVPSRVDKTRRRRGYDSPPGRENVSASKGRATRNRRNDTDSGPFAFLYATGPYLHLLWCSISRG